MVEKWLRYLPPAISPTALWLFDRGFDGGYILKVLCDLGLRWVVRMVGNRNAFYWLHFDTHNNPLPASELHLPGSRRIKLRS